MYLGTKFKHFLCTDLVNQLNCLLTYGRRISLNYLVNAYVLILSLAFRGKRKTFVCHGLTV